jgi:hypothetical protein
MKLFGRGRGPSRDPSPDRASAGETSQAGDKPRRNLKSRLGDKNRYAWLISVSKDGWGIVKLFVVHLQS